METIALLTAIVYLVCFNQWKKTVGTGTGTAEEQTQADKNRKDQHVLRPSLLRRLRSQAVFLHLQELQGQQPEPFRLLQLQEQYRLLQNPLYPGTGALPDCAGNHTADIELCPYVPEGFQAGNAGAGRGKPQGRTGRKTESPLRGEKTDGGFGPDYPAYL